ncbi:MAG: FHA domain-containing protein [Planctomycetes bacterium]|nr:FHA domain-containing protein [Planctomycetota bacterium]
MSRVHARIINEDGLYYLEDANSTSGTLVNGKPTTKCVLAHEDSIEIGTYVMQFRMCREASDVGAVAGRAELLLRGKYRTLPTNVRLRFRVLAEGSALDASSVATLPTEQGGLLIPLPEPPGDASSLELELSTPSGNTGRLLGELAGVVQEGDKYWMCVRTHRIPKRQYEVVIAGKKPGPWQEVCPV